MKLYLKMMAMLYELEGAGLVLDKNVPVCLIQTVPEKWGCIDHTCIFFFFNIRWSWERQWKIGVDFLFAFGTHSEAQVCGEKITGVDVKLLI